MTNTLNVYVFIRIKRLNITLKVTDGVGQVRLVDMYITNMHMFYTEFINCMFNILGKLDQY